MTKPVLLGISAYFLGLAAFLLISPAGFYATVPGVADTGPLNPHFMRDVGLAFAVSGACLGYGVLRARRALALAGAAFPLLHGGYHLVHWAGHGARIDGAAMAEILVTAGLALLTFGLALRIGRVAQ